ncbi:polyprenyl synthetase family protein [Allokutzneria albata]|uniref:Geranylgeranyl pyrophosphate synthase n=1 Tax=Allokutzneria albata TaxID=211114 RepID=A0A1G9SHM2_ALLAB|nr:polyprenyl synthetase family protein [Allokutzneria albata]SDM34929.1 Geranylgeranyl pyrophosphate synthase [Allokutzneria albata]
MSVVVPENQDVLVPLIEAELRRWIGPGENLMELVCLDALFPSGKLLRPILCLESAAAVGGEVEQVLAFAAGIECLHVASVVHDDIVDQEPVRRGRASTSEQFGISEALLAGDGLSMAGHAAMLSRGPADRALAASRVVVDAMRHMCRAMMRETEIREDLSCGVSTALEVIRGKTAALISAACQGGAILGGATPEQAEALRRYGEQLGIAFQIRDDLLPYTADEDITGKAAQSDVANRLPTVPVLLAHEAGTDADRQRLAEVFRDDVDTVTAYREVRDIVIRTGGAEQAAQRAWDCVEHARAALAGVPRPDRLLELAVTAVDRIH